MDVNFSGAVLPGPGLDQVHLITDYVDGKTFCDVRDNNAGVHNVHVWTGAYQTGFNTTATAGRSRILRTGSYISGYLDHELIWTSNYTSAAMSTSPNFNLQNNLGSNDNTFVIFDDFRLEAVNLLPPTAACCYPDGTCTVTTQAECIGIWHGEWANCGVGQCPQPTGACCLRNGPCEQLTQAACTQANGLAWTMNTPCTPNPCPYVRGDVNCDHAVNMDDVPYFVAALIGGYTGCDITLADMNCDGNADGLDIAPFVDCLVNSNFPPCPTGSCCQTNGSCTVTTQANCTGTWTQGGTCSPNPCPEPTGACCAPNASCTVTTEAGCTGVWHAEWADCGVAQCPLLTGACCYLATGFCLYLTEADCNGFDVVWYFGETCATFDCP
jgi:hypothetical protein